MSTRAATFLVEYAKRYRLITADSAGVLEKFAAAEADNTKAVN
nr:hypothetical protein [Mycobacterium haemophilum]